MKITISQQDKKILIKFFYSDARHRRGRSPDLDSDGTVGVCVGVDRAEDFLLVVDKFLKKHKIRPIGQIGHIEFKNTGLLTERIIKAIIAGLRFK